MKKIFTLIFSVGLLTSAAFAQTDYGHQSIQGNSNGYQQTQYQVGNQFQGNNQYSRDNQKGYAHTYGDNDGYSKNSHWNQPAKEQYGHYQDRDMQRKDEMIHRDQTHYPVQYGNQPREDNDRFIPQRKAPVLPALIAGVLLGLAIH